MRTLLLYSAASLVIAFFSSWLGSFIGLRAYRRLPAGAHWAERARLSYPVRAASVISAIFICAIGVVIAIVVFEHSDGLLWIIGVAVCAVVGSGFVASRVVRRILGPEIRLQNRMRWWVAQLMMVGTYLAVLIVAPILLPHTFNTRAIMILAIALIILVAIACGGGFWVLQKLRILVPASPHLEAIARAAEQRTCIDMRGAFELKASVANAAAFPIQRWVIFTSRALEVLTDAQISAVFGHELAHLSESRAVTILRVFTSVQMVFTIVLMRPVEGEFGFPGFAALLAFMVLVIFISRRIMRRMEERADKVAMAQEEEEGTYALALEKLYEINLVPAVMRSKRRIHPHLYDRMVEAGITPSFLRPPPPPRAPKLLYIATSVLTAVLLYALVFGLLPH
jgi:Zn-dependent protease with chaperone function